MLLRLPILLTVTLMFCNQLAAEEPKPAKTPEQQEASAALAAGNQLKKEGKIAEALAKYKEGLAKQPDSANLLWNAGIASQETHDYDTALDCWKKMRKIEPDNWRIRAKLIQSYQAKGLATERDEERKGLLDFYKKAPNEEMMKQECYCREQCEVVKQKVMVLEHFELKGDQAMRYEFVVLDDEGKSKFKITLGSYDVTNEIMKESGAVKAGDRGFHLDGYYEGGRIHKTFAMFTSEPAYDDVRKKFVDIMEGKAAALSGTTFGAAPDKKDDGKSK